MLQSAGEWRNLCAGVESIRPQTQDVLRSAPIEEGNRYAGHAPLLRIGDDDDLKGATLLFASQAGKHITGQILPIDGGVSAIIAA